MASLDILGALRRMVTLPKARNSLDDILGAQRAEALKALAREQIGNAVSAAAAVVNAAALEAPRALLEAVARAARIDSRTAGALYRTLEAEILAAWQARCNATSTEMASAVTAAACHALGL